jgi:hypothetical protein
MAEDGLFAKPMCGTRGEAGSIVIRSAQEPGPCRHRWACCWSNGLRPTRSACFSPSARTSGWRRITYGDGPHRQGHRPVPARLRSGTRPPLLILAENGIDTR